MIHFDINNFQLSSSSGYSLRGTSDDAHLLVHLEGPNRLPLSFGVLLRLYGLRKYLKELSQDIEVHLNQRQLVRIKGGKLKLSYLNLIKTLF